MKKIISAILALSMLCCLSVTALAAEVDTNGGSGSSSVNLSSTLDGTLGGTPAATAMSVTVPTALPMAMAQNGDVTTADNCQIINWSYGAVRVASVTIRAEGGWKLTAFGDKSTLSGEKVNSNKFGFALSIGGGVQVETDNSDAAVQSLISAPIAGCYLSGVGDPTANTAAVEYSAIVTPLSDPISDATIASVVFVIEWDTAD